MCAMAAGRGFHLIGPASVQSWILRIHTPGCLANVNFIAPRQSIPFRCPIPGIVTKRARSGDAKECALEIRWGVNTKDCSFKVLRAEPCGLRTLKDAQIWMKVALLSELLS